MESEKSATESITSKKQGREILPLHPMHDSFYCFLAPSPRPRHCPMYIPVCPRAGNEALYTLPTVLLHLAVGHQPVHAGNDCHSSSPPLNRLVMFALQPHTVGEYTRQHQHHETAQKQRQVQPKESVHLHQA